VSELSCQEIVELVSDYVEGTLPPNEAERFERHLASCPGCARYVDQIRTTIRLSGRPREETLAPELRAGLLAQFRDWRRDG
jgi:anti-sigma factor RsiW